MFILIKILNSQSSEWADAYGFTTEGFLEVAIESYSEWDSNPQPLNSNQRL